jgi:hypothetical protein
MRIALDYDKTYTADTELWDAFIAIARARGHLVDIVTMRNENELVDKSIAKKVDHIVYTCRKGKKRCMEFIDRPVDIWIDDMPQFILEDAWTGD